MACVLAVLLPASAGWCATATTAPSGAKPAATPPVAVPDEPSVTTASFADWTLRCQHGAAGRMARICEVGEAIHVAGQANPVAQVAIGRLGPGDPLRFTALLPATVSFPSTVRVGLGTNDGMPLDLAWRRCLASACVAEAEIREDMLTHWRGATEPGHLTFLDAAGRTLTLPLSMNGLAQALVALAKEQP